MISVILCVHKTNPYLRRAIESVLTQDMEDFEFLIGANGCSDELFDELHLITRKDPRVQIFRTSLPQLAFTLNFLIDKSSNSWVARMDADDICEPHRLRRLTDHVSPEGPDVIGSWATLIDSEDKVIGQFEPPTDSPGIRRALLIRNPLCHPSVAFSKHFWLRMRGYIGGYASEDFDLWLRAQHFGARLTNIPEPLLRYRIHAGQVSRSRLGYAETASHWYRMLLAHPCLYHLTGWTIASMKAIVMPTLNSIRKRTQQSRGSTTSGI